MDTGDFPSTAWNRRLDVDGKHIDFFQGDSNSQRGLRNCFGIRVEDGFCSAVIRIDEESPSQFGDLYALPIQLECMPSFVRMIIDDHLLNHPGSDLMELLTGKKSFKEAVNSGDNGNDGSVPSHRRADGVP